MNVCVCLSVCLFAYTVNFKCIHEAVGEGYYLSEVCQQSKQRQLKLKEGWQLTCGLLRTFNSKLHITVHNKYTRRCTMTLTNMSNTFSGLFIIPVNPMSHILGWGREILAIIHLFIIFFTLINFVPTIPIVDRYKIQLSYS